MSSTFRWPGPPRIVEPSCRVVITDTRLAAVLPANAELLELHAGGIHVEGPAWQAARRRLLFSDVSNRRLCGWYEEDNRVEVVIDASWFINGNVIAPDGSVWHCEHGRRSISRSAPDCDGQPAPIVTHYGGKRLNSPNDLTIAPDGAIWFTDPIFGIVMPSQGGLAKPELEHRSVYRYDPVDGSLDRMADFEQPNGIAFSPDGGTLYVSDTSASLGEVPSFKPGAKHEIEAFDIGDDNALTNRRLFYRSETGYPDGFAIDGRGWLWISGAEGVDILAHDGARLGSVAIPAVVSNVAFDHGERRLFIAASDRLFGIDLMV